MGGSLRLKGVIVGLIGNVLIGVSLYHLMQVGSCGGFRAPCPDDLTPYFFALPAGILISVVGIFMGGGAVIFSGVFLAVGLGSMAAAAFGGGKEMAGFGWWFGGMFAFFGLAPLILMLVLRPMARAKEAQAMRLVATGSKGVGTITDVRDTGVTINGNPRVEIVMHIEPVDGGAAIERKKTATVSRVAVPRVGERYPVWYDPQDEENWAFGTDMDASAPPDVQALFAKARGPGPAPAAAGTDAGPSPLEELSRLNELRKVGAVTEREFETAKAQLLAQIGRGPG
jgi:hypothetical protein